MIAVYLRVSSHSQSLESQREEVSRWLKRHRIAPKRVQWFEEIDTGTTMRRAAMIRMQEAIFNGEIDTVIVWKLDRLSRKTADGIALLASWFEADVRLISVTQQIDLTGAVGRMVASLLFGVAEIEHEYRKERQAAGIALARKRGAYKGRKPGTTRARPKRAAALRAKGLTVDEIAQALGVARNTVYNYLNTPTEA